MQTFITAPIDLLAWRLLKFYGIDPDQCFSQAGLSKEQLEDHETRITYAVSDDIWLCTQRLIDDPCAGLNAVHFWHPSTPGALCYAGPGIELYRKVSTEKQ